MSGWGEGEHHAGSCFAQTCMSSHSSLVYIYMLKAYLLKDVGTTAMVFPRQALADDWGIVSKRH